jgi:hypothetical protein
MVRPLLAPLFFCRRRQIFSLNVINEIRGLLQSACKKSTSKFEANIGSLYQRFLAHLFASTKIFDVGCGFWWETSGDLSVTLFFKK